MKMSIFNIRLPQDGYLHFQIYRKSKSSDIVLQYLQSCHASTNLFQTFIMTHCYSSPLTMPPFLAGGHDASQQGIKFLKSSRGMPRILQNNNDTGGSLDVDEVEGRCL